MSRVLTPRSRHTHTFTDAYIYNNQSSRPLKLSHQPLITPTLRTLAGDMIGRVKLAAKSMCVVFTYSPVCVCILTSHTHTKPRHAKAKHAVENFMYGQQTELFVWFSLKYV